MEERIRIMLPLLDERQRRIFLAAEAKTYGRGGISTVSRLSGAAPYTIRQGLKEIDSGEPIERKEKMRLQGAGRKKLQDNIPDIEMHIQEIVDGSTYGDPQKYCLIRPSACGRSRISLPKISYRHQLPLCQQHSGKTGVQQTGKPENAPGWRTPS